MIKLGLFYYLLNDIENVADDLAEFTMKLDKHCCWGTDMDMLVERFSNLSIGDIAKMLSDGDYTKYNKYWCLENGVINGYDSAVSMFKFNYPAFYRAVNLLISNDIGDEFKETKLYKWKKLSDTAEFKKNEDNLNNLLNGLAIRYDIKLIVVDGRISAENLYDCTSGNEIKVCCSFSNSIYNALKLDEMINLIRFVEDVNLAKFKLIGV